MFLKLCRTHRLSLWSAFTRRLAHWNEYRNIHQRETLSALLIPLLTMKMISAVQMEVQQMMVS